MSDEFGPLGGQPEDQFVDPMTELLMEWFDTDKIKDPEIRARRFQEALKKIDQASGEALPKEQKDIYTRPELVEAGLDPIVSGTHSDRSQQDHLTGTTQTLQQLPLDVARKYPIFNKQDREAFSPQVITDAVLQLLPPIIIAAVIRRLLKRLNS